MTIAEAKRFYKQDQQKYVVLKNKELLRWLKSEIKNGYAAFNSLEDLQDLIDNLVHWYELKYPEKEMEYNEGTFYFDYMNMTRLSKQMNLQQLLYRLPQNQLNLIECNYRSYGGGLRNLYNDKGEVVGSKAILFMKIVRKNYNYEPFTVNSKLPDFLLYADCDTGSVDIDYNLREFVDVDSISLDELLILFKTKYKEQLAFINLEECVNDHNCDVELRRKILQLVALKLLYSRNTIPERGYERAKRFINEFNKKMNLNLSTSEIDEIFNSDYKLVNSKQKGLKKRY